MDTKITKGGYKQHRGLDRESAFEVTVDHALGAWIRESDVNAQAMWSALTNTHWIHRNGETVGYTFRAAGDLVAAIREAGNYLDWYCRGPYGRVSEKIAAEMQLEGWTASPSAEPHDERVMLGDGIGGPSKPFHVRAVPRSPK